eukprot:gene47348-50709_t
MGATPVTPPPSPVTPPAATPPPVPAVTPPPATTADAASEGGHQSDVTLEGDYAGGGDGGGMSPAMIGGVAGACAAAVTAAGGAAYREPYASEEGTAHDEESSPASAFSRPGFKVPSLSPPDLSRRMSPVSPLAAGGDRRASSPVSRLSFSPRQGDGRTPKHRTFPVVGPLMGAAGDDLFYSKEERDDTMNETGGMAECVGGIDDREGTMESGFRFGDNPSFNYDRTDRSISPQRDLGGTSPPRSPASSLGLPASPHQSTADGIGVLAPGLEGRHGTGVIASLPPTPAMPDPNNFSPPPTPGIPLCPQAQEAEDAASDVSPLPASPPPPLLCVGACCVAARPPSPDGSPSRESKQKARRWPPPATARAAAAST